MRTEKLNSKNDQESEKERPHFSTPLYWPFLKTYYFFVWRFHLIYFWSPYMSEEGTGPSGVRATDVCEPQWGCWESKLGLRGEQPVLTILNLLSSQEHMTFWKARPHNLTFLSQGQHPLRVHTIDEIRKCRGNTSNKVECELFYPPQCLSQSAFFEVFPSTLSYYFPTACPLLLYFQ